MPVQGDNNRAPLGAEVPTNEKDALVKWAHEQSTAYENVSISDHVREAISEYLNNHWDELPEKARNDIQRSQLADPDEPAVEAVQEDDSS